MKSLIEENIISNSIILSHNSLKKFVIYFSNFIDNFEAGGGNF